MQYFFYIAVFNAFFFTLLLFQKKSRMIHDNILIVWLIYLGLFIGSYSLYSHELFTHFNLLSASFISLFMLQGVFLYLYASRLVSKRYRFNKKMLLHLLPFVAFNIYLLGASFFPDVANEIRLENVHTNVHHPLLFQFFLIITLLSGPFYFVLTLRLFKKHDINVFNNFSSIETINLKWLRKLVIIFGVVWTALIIITVIHHVFNLFSMVFCTDSLFLTLSVFVILIGYFGLKQKVIFENEFEEQPVLAEEKMKYSSSTLKEDEASEYAKRLIDYMHLEKPYLNPELTLTHLASEIDISTHHLSQIINEQFKLNFFEYINQFRVEEVKSRINDPKFEHYSLLGIALDSGFNSKSSFNRIFKKFTNQTPSQFKSALIDK
ncbi:MAG: AraC family transcriptional regulator [Dysgonamonadaceae bacterium]|nr:AraC family transcriptional regulator [Dysgonamonadaceae bacterium]MDD4246991.1 AraC family transcriptional regulator [Dysgonamonadaceae bacterium]HUI33739.1 AraC family transcriptional regulator [Dysgonamonadaceae bacterium]